MVTSALMPASALCSLFSILSVIPPLIDTTNVVVSISHNITCSERRSRPLRD